MTQPQPVPQGISIEIPDDVIAGTYADFVSVWHTSDAFVLDFAAMKHSNPTVGQDENGQPVDVLAARIVQRVKIPASQVFELMKALEQQLSGWEAGRGEGPSPGA